MARNKYFNVVIVRGIDEELFNRLLDKLVKGAKQNENRPLVFGTTEVDFDIQMIGVNGMKYSGVEALELLIQDRLNEQL